MATLSVTKPSVKGGFVLDANNKAVPTPYLGSSGAAVSADDFPNPGNRTYLILYNTETPTTPPAAALADQTVTITPQGRPSGLVVAPYTISIPAGCTAIVGPFDPNLFNNQGGSISVLPANMSKIRVTVLQV